MERNRLTILEKDTLCTINTTEIHEKKKRGCLSSKHRKTVDMILNLSVYFLLIPIVAYLGFFVWKNGSYNVVALIIAVLAIMPMCIIFEHGESHARELVVIAVMTAMSVVGRAVFAPLPGFKPVTAIVIVTGASCGMQAGFITGAMSALVSNFAFGQGPWTPFQMLAWGIIGGISGLLSIRRGRPSLILLALVGVLGGVLYSMLMDIWTTLSVDRGFTLARYLSFVTASLPFMGIYAVSNVIFLCVGGRQLSGVLCRMRRKYLAFDRLERRK